MNLKYSSLNNYEQTRLISFGGWSIYEDKVEEKPGKYRVEWVNSNGYEGHGDWLTYSEAKSWVDFLKIHYPKMTHRIGQFIESNH